MPLGPKHNQEALNEPPLLSFPDPDLPNKVISDASITGCGAILSQEDRPVAYVTELVREKVDKHGHRRNVGVGVRLQIS